MKLDGVLYPLNLFFQIWSRKSVELLKIYKKMYWDCVIYYEVKALPKNMQKPRHIKGIIAGLEGIRDENYISYEEVKKQLKYLQLVYLNKYN